LVGFGLRYFARDAHPELCISGEWCDSEGGVLHRVVWARARCGDPSNHEEEAATLTVQSANFAIQSEDIAPA
jgi:hypothetical protein